MLEKTSIRGIISAGNYKRGHLSPIEHPAGRPEGSVRARLSLDVIRVARRDLRGNADNLEYSVAAESLSGIFISAERLQCGHDGSIDRPAGRRYDICTFCSPQVRYNGCSAGESAQSITQPGGGTTRARSTSRLSLGRCKFTKNEEDKCCFLEISLVRRDRKCYNKRKIRALPHDNSARLPVPAFGSSGVAGVFLKGVFFSYGHYHLCRQFLPSERLPRRDQHF